MNQTSIIHTITAVGISLRGDEIDTDRIIPARFLRCVTFDGLGEQAFFDERFDENGTVKTHPFNDSRYAGAGILVVNRNFGCGSSREHAPQALARWGIKALIAESYADIFAGNCASIGVPAVTASTADVSAAQEILEKTPGTRLEINLETMHARILDHDFPVTMPESHRRKFLSGSWDTTAALLANREKISLTAASLPYLNFNKKACR